MERNPNIELIDYFIRQIMDMTENITENTNTSILTEIYLRLLDIKKRVEDKRKETGDSNYQNVLYFLDMRINMIEEIFKKKQQVLNTGNHRNNTNNTNHRNNTNNTNHRNNTNNTNNTNNESSRNNGSNVTGGSKKMKKSSKKSSKKVAKKKVMKKKTTKKH
jgi:hypothetical protein